MERIKSVESPPTPERDRPEIPAAGDPETGPPELAVGRVETKEAEKRMDALLSGIETARAELRIVAEAKAATPRRIEAPNEGKKGGRLSRLFGGKKEGHAPDRRNEEYRALGATEYLLKKKLAKLEAELEAWRVNAPEDLKKIADIRLSL